MFKVGQTVVWNKREDEKNHGITGIVTHEIGGNRIWVKWDNGRYTYHCFSIEFVDILEPIFDENDQVA